MTTRQTAAPLATVIDSLTATPYVTRLGVQLSESQLGRHRQHPGWVVYAYGALARHFRSANRLDAELTTGVWQQLRDAANAAGLPDPGGAPFVYHHYAYWRDQGFGDRRLRRALLDTFTTVAIEQARSAGLLNPNGPGSLTRPHPDRTIYGDGTVVRPIYRGPTDHNDRPGDNRPPTIRHDPSAQIHQRHDGPIRGNDFVTFATRTSQPSSRIILGIDRVPQPGREADTAVQLARRIANAARGGIQAVVYDGAFKGVHIDELMRTAGVIVINRQAAAARTDTTVTPKRHPLGIYTHTTADTTTCTHTLHAVNGTITDIALADDGTLVAVATATRKQTKRASRKDGTYRFNLNVTIPCPNGDFTLWFSPHAKHPGDPTPEHIRLLPPDDPYFQTMYGRRNDAESLNNQYKRTLLVGRAASVGWQRQLHDLLTYATLHNSLNQRQVN